MYVIIHLIVDAVVNLLLMDYHYVSFCRVSFYCGVAIVPVRKIKILFYNMRSVKSQTVQLNQCFELSCCDIEAL